MLLSRVQYSVYPVMSPLQPGMGINFHWNMAEVSSRVRSTETEGGRTEEVEGKRYIVTGEVIINDFHRNKWNCLEVYWKHNYSCILDRCSFN